MLIDARSVRTWAVLLLLVAVGAWLNRQVRTSAVPASPTTTLARVTSSSPPISPAVQSLLSLDPATHRRLSQVLQRARPAAALEKQKIHALLHALRLWGPSAEFPTSDCLSGPQMLRVLLDTGAYQSFCPGASPLLLGSRFGVAVRVSGEYDATPHTDKLLSVLAEAGVSLDTAVVTAAHETTVASILADSTARFQLDQPELEWTAVAFASYLPPAAAWVNHFGEKFSFDGLARKLLQRDQGDGPCYGTHVLYALAYLLRVDESSPVVSPGVRADILARLTAASARLVRSQYATGCWTEQWHLDAPPTRAATLEPPLAVKNRIRATGHHLEWIALAPRSAAPSTEPVARAARYVTRAALSMSTHETIEAYCPLTHAARALCRLYGVHPGAVAEHAAAATLSPSPPRAEHFLAPLPSQP